MEWIAHNQLLASEYRKQERQKITRVKQKQEIKKANPNKNGNKINQQKQIIITNKATKQQHNK